MLSAGTFTRNVQHAHARIVYVLYTCNVCSEVMFLFFAKSLSNHTRSLDICASREKYSFAHRFSSDKSFVRMSKHVESCCAEESEVPYERRIQKIPGILEPAPSWSGTAVIDSKFQDISLKSFEGKYLVLLFYPYDFTFACPTELIQFNDRIDEFLNLDTEIVAASTDSQYAHVVWVTTPRKQGGLGNMKIPMLADKSHKISKDYGVLDEANGIPYRALFVIDRKQLVRHVTINEIAIPRSVDEVLRLIQACQFIDKYGDICPIGPKTGENTPNGGPNYFSTHLED